MTGIFPTTGGVIVRDPNTNLPVPAPNVSGVKVPPATFDMDCTMTALPNDCRIPPENRQINAIISELVNLAAAFDPNGSWECAEYDNLSDAFKEWVENFSGSSAGELLCGSTAGDGTETGAAVLYCDGGVIKKLIIDGDEGLLQMVEQYLCDSTTGAPNTNDDYFLYCRNGEVRKTQAITYQLYTGEWAQARAYNVNNLVRRSRKLYSPNAAIPSGTAFVIGTAGATWYEVSATDWSEWTPTESYVQDTIIQWTDGKTYAANADIPAGTPFVIGTTGETWRLVDTTKVAILDHSASKKYLQNEVVSVNGLLFRATTPVGPAAFSAKPAGPWAPIGGERNIYMGDWSQTNNATAWSTSTQYQYLVGQTVHRDGRIYRANANMPLNTPFNEGTAGATWKEISASVAPPFTEDIAYAEGTVIQYTDGKYYRANADIPAGTPFVIGISGETWSLIDFGGGSLTIAPVNTAKAYASGELALGATGINANGQLGGILRAKAAGVPAGPFNINLWDVIGERSKFRGRWQSGANYLVYDLVLVDTNVGGVRVDVEVFYATADIANSQAIPTDGFVWRPLSNDRGQYSNYRTYFAGDIVSHEGSKWIANSNITKGYAFTKGTENGTWRQADLIPPLVRSDFPNAYVERENIGRYTILNGTGPKNLILDTAANSSNPPIGTVMTFCSVFGQTTIAPVSGVIVRTPKTLAIRNGNYAVFTLTKVATNEWHLAGDLA